MLPMFVTLDVSKFLTSSDVSLEQPWNMQYMLVTFDVSKLDTSSDVRPEQPKNM